MAVNALRTGPDAYCKMLSKREMELLPMLGHGDSNQDIGAAFSISPLTVKFHREKIMQKLGIHSSDRLIRWAAEKGFSSFFSPALGLSKPVRGLVQ